MSHLMTRCATVALMLGLWASGTSAQSAAPRTGKLVVTVVDFTGAVLPGATVTITGTETATRAAATPPAKTTPQGLATFDGLVPGRYSLQADFSGFDSAMMKDLRVRAGDNKQTLSLSLRKMETSVTVGRDEQESAADRSATFGTAMTREQIEALSDDPTEMRNQLLGMASPDAVIKVDSFEGQQLPPKAQIKSIRVTRDQFAAENHYAGGISIEIITQPGVGPLRGQVRTGFYDSALDGRNPFVGQKGPGQNRNLGGSIGGSLLKEKASFSLNLNAADSYSTPVQSSVTPGGAKVISFGPRNPSENSNVGAQLDFALTRDQTLRVAVGRNTYSQDNLGTSDFNSIERAYSTESKGYNFRIQEVGPLGRRFFINTRFSMNTSTNRSQSVLEAPTIIVNEAFTVGGAQRTGSTNTKSFTIASDLDYVRGRHSVRAGVTLDGTKYRTDANSNYLGTYTFENLDAYAAGRPRSFTQRIGDPVIRYSNVFAGFYIQDDIKLRKNLTITPGIRYEAQTHLKDYLNFGPRFGITWAPFKSGKTTLRASAGVFFDWLNTGTFEQTLRFDGFRQQSVNIASPSYPNPGTIGSATPVDRYLLSPDLVMPHTTRLSAGISQTLTSRMTVGATYAYGRGSDLFVGQNLNAPVNGARPDPRFANVYMAVSGGRVRQHSLGANLNYNLGTVNPQSNGRLFVPRRGLQAFTNYNIGRAWNDTGGPFSIPATGKLADDWGPSGEDIRHRGGFGVASSMIRNLSMTIQFNGSSARPLTILTGYDDNGDLLLNDRPAGVGRNTARTSGQWTSYSSFQYAINLGKRQVNSGTGVSITSSGGGYSVNTSAGQSVARYRLLLSSTIQNITNHANYFGHSGVMTSPYFLQPTSAQGVRQINFNVGLSF